MWTSDHQRAFQTFKRRLTRYTNVKDFSAIVSLWDEFRDYFDSRSVAWPDDWRRWERAAEDATYALKRREAGI